MKMTKWTVIGAGAILAVASACSAEWLHQAYQGSFCAHGYKYIVDNSGTITVQDKESAGAIWSSGGGYSPAPPKWTDKIAFKDLGDLDNVIGDLQKVSKELHKQLGDDGASQPGCVQNCDK